MSDVYLGMLIQQQTKLFFYFFLFQTINADTLKCFYAVCLTVFFLLFPVINH